MVVITAGNFVSIDVFAGDKVFWKENDEFLEIETMNEEGGHVNLELVDGNRRIIERSAPLYLG